MTDDLPAAVKIKPAGGGKPIPIDPEQINLIDELEALSSAQGRFGRKARSGDVDWPEPLGPAAHHGIVGELLEFIDGKSEGDPAAILVQFLVGFGNMVGRQHFALVESSRHHPLLWVAIVGNTAKARKGTSLNNVIKLLSCVDPSWGDSQRRSGLSTGEGILAR